jgi:16S rRNA (guanine1516-N2)-methyltransferase
MSLKITGRVAIINTCNVTLTRARKLATKLNLPLISLDHSYHDFSFVLAVTPVYLELRETNIKHIKPIIVDFLKPTIDYRIRYGGGKKQLIAKAMGIKNSPNLSIVDTTAGFGTDSLILASLGCEVIMIERSPIISALLNDGLQRLEMHQNKNLKITLYTMQAIDYINKILQNRSKKPDVIYLDPMYPKRANSALNKIAMRTLHKLVGDDEDAPQLLIKALQCTNLRVVVKRPRHAEYLGSLKPDLQLSSSGSSRFDIYFTKQNKCF